MTQPNRYDLLVVGGGINGAGIARDAAGRGLSVMLCEQDDLASHTSSSSTKLIHGGLRYLEYNEFGRAQGAAGARDAAARGAAHHVAAALRDAAHAEPASGQLIRIGLFLYDHLAKRELLPARAASTCAAMRPARR